MAQDIQLAGPRLPYPTGVDERFHCDRATWRALVDAVFPAAKSSEAVVLALAYCSSRKLDIMRRPVHIVPMWSTPLKRMVETVWPGIGEHRITAHRTGQYAGCDETEYGPDVNDVFEGVDGDGKVIKVKLTYPAWAQHTLYKRSRTGERDKVVGPRVRFLETYATTKKASQLPNDRWQRAPYQMLGKCAESQTLRMAFPEELGNEPVAEEMEGREIDSMTTTVIRPTTAESPITNGDEPAYRNSAAPPEPAPVVREPPDDHGNGHSDEHDEPDPPDEPDDAENDDITVQVADEKPAAPRSNGTEAHPAAAAEQLPEILLVAAHPTEGGRGTDWSRYVADFKAAINATLPKHIDDFLLANDELLKRMKKQASVGHHGLMLMLDRRRTGATL